LHPFAVSVAAVIAIGVVTAVVLAPHPVPTRGGKVGPPVSRTHSEQLTWRPPRCGDATHTCRNVNLTNTGVHISLYLDRSSDYRIHLPVDSPLIGGLSIEGGNRVQIVGGEIDLTTPCDDTRSTCHGINIWRGSPSGQVYIEGVLIRNPDPTHSKYTGDGIDVADGVGTLVIQNVRIEGIDGCDPKGNPAAHADVFQPWNANGMTLKVDHLTGTTDCQGMQIGPDFAYKQLGNAPKSGTFKNVNIDVLPNPHTGAENQYAWWFTYAANSCGSYPISLTNTYAQQPRGTLKTNAVWPDTTTRFGCPAVFEHGRATWPKLASLTGHITNGQPPGGDFVPEGAAGLDYVSPGYLEG
jgi:hypothetical protein